MGDLHVPPPHHLFDVGGDLIKRHRLREVVTGAEIVANFLRRHVRDDGAVRDIRSERRHRTPDVIERHL
jgi:hypothetical protein